MNYLSHIVLAKSGKIQIGAFISDAVKGNNYKQYSKHIQLGILQHRMIDSLIDNDKNVAKVTVLFRPKYGKYSGIVTDIIFDYFLLKNWNKYKKESIIWFVLKFYINVFFNYLIFPKRMKRFAKIVIFNNLTAYYKSTSGVAKVLNLMFKYRGIPNESGFAIDVINDNYEFINNIFNNFFKEAMNEANNFLVNNVSST